jgi:type VI secretion system protein ImpA
MPLRNDLLNPISAENPSGNNLRYDPLYDKIKEARREDADVPQGEWQRERKLADWPLTIKLIVDALATKTKDLQLAAWLGEALLRREGISGLREVLDLTRGLMENFWDGLYPEMEDGDLEIRVGPLQWIGDKLDLGVKLAPITSGGLSWAQYDESRQVGTEEAAAESYEKQAAREAKIAEGKTPPEKFEKEFEETPKAFYAALEQTIDQTLESLSRLSQLCDERFADVSPSFGLLKKMLEEVRQTVHILLVRKREKEPDEAQPPAPASTGDADSPEARYVAGAASPARKPAAVTALPENWEDAVARVVAAAAFMRQVDAYNPAPYLMLRSLRWGELRASGTNIDQLRLAAPPPEIRQSLKRAAMDSQWTEVLETAETAMGMECGRGWLDLQRYVVRACQELGGYYEPVRRAIVGELKNLLECYPQLLDMTMMDDMPTANAETQAWLKKHVLRSSVTAGSRAESEEAFSGDGTALSQRALDLAMQAARAGRPEAGVELLMREIAQEPSGRGRFQRKVQLAQICLRAGNEVIAIPILQEAVAEIEQKKLEDWEAREMLAYSLGVLYRCLVKSGGSSDERDRLYSWICRLDPLEAMKLER